MASVGRRWWGWRRVLIAAACVLVALPPSAAEQAMQPPEAAPVESQILVMIRMAPAHFRPDVNYGDGYAGRSGQAARRRVADQIAHAHRLQLQSHWPMPAIGVECFVMAVPPDLSATAVAEAVSRDPRAAWAQPMQTFHGQGYDDPLYDQQPVASLWHLQSLHGAATGRGVLIALIDSGADAEHPDLREQIRVVRNMVGGPYAAERHGTAVAGVMVARAENHVGMVGVAPGAALIALRACWERVPGSALCDSLSLAKALQFALDRDARIINMSLSGPPDRLLAELLNVALERGTVVVAPVAAGAADGGFPASQHGVIAVIDMESAAAVAAPPSALAAPGHDVPAPLPGGRWGLVSGASFATAEVSGMVALLLELLPQARSTQIEGLLQGRGDSKAAHAAHAPTAIQACRTVSAAAGHCVCQCTVEASRSLVLPR